jgi:uncharacterized surface protein with fasciclin (FAS1) repeats
MSDRLNLIDTIAKEDTFSTFARLLRTSKANDIFNGEGEFTVFAPTNDAFAKFPDHTLNGLLSETGQTRLRELLSYHFLPGKVMAGSLASSPSRKAFTGEELLFTDSSGLKINGASVQARNFEATNGVVHALDTVLTPKTPTATKQATAPLVTPTAISSRTVPAVPNAPVEATATTTPIDPPTLSAVPASASTAAAGAETKSIL